MVRTLSNLPSQGSLNAPPTLHLLCKAFLSICHVPGPVLGTEDIVGDGVAPVESNGPLRAFSSLCLCLGICCAL